MGPKDWVIVFTAVALVLTLIGALREARGHEGVHPLTSGKAECVERWLERMGPRDDVQPSLVWAQVEPALKLCEHGIPLTDPI